MRKGFTLTELVVVMGVTAVMAGMLVPAVVEAQNNGREKCCMNNLRQLTIAVQQSAFQNNDVLPREDRNIPKNLFKPEYFRGDEFINLGLPKETYICPSNPIMMQKDGMYHGSEYEFGIKNWETSFFYLANVDGKSNSYEVDEYVADGGNIRCKFRKRQRICRDGRYPIWSDRVSYNASHQEWTINHVKEVGRGRAKIRGGNVSYLDGHIKWHGSGYYPNELLVDPAENPYGNPVAVHDPSIEKFRHRYWW